MNNFDNIVNDPLFQMGLGILGANRPGISAGQAIGQGGLLGLGNYQQAMAQNQRLGMMAAEQEERKRQAQLAEEDRQRKLAALELIRQRNPTIAPYIEAAPNAIPQLMAAQNRQTTFGKTPAYFEGPGGLQMGLISDAGEVMFPQLPQGMKPVKPVTFQDYGSGIAAIPYGSGTPASVIAKDLPPEQTPQVKGAQAEASAAGQVRGKSGAEAEVGLDQALAEAQNAISVIDQMVSHPGLDYAVGASSMLPIIPGTPAADFDALARQLEGKAFLQAFETLKGGGQITQIEGEKATAAMARLSRAQTEAEYKASLRELKNIWQAGMSRGRSKARQSQARQQGGNFSGFRIIEDQ